MEGSDKEGGVVVKGIVAGDGKEEVLVNIFILGAPDLLTTFVDDSVLMRVVGDSSGAWWGSEEMGEELGFQGNWEREVREDRSGWGGGGNGDDGGFNDGWWEILYGDVSKQDMLDNFFKLKVDVGILVFGGQRILELGAYNVSLLGGNVGKDMEEVGWGGNDRGWEWGAIDIKAQGRAITTWARVVPGVVGTIEVVLDDLVGGSNVDLVSVVDLGPISNRKGRGDDEGG
jgi:hypothetical protein